MGLAGALQHQVLGQNFDARAGRHVGRVIRGAGFEPADQGLCGLAVLLENLAAGVRRRAVDFRKQQ